MPAARARVARKKSYQLSVINYQFLPRAGGVAR
jgi:hypothetical protein